MQCIATYATRMYSYLSEISFEISVLTSCTSHPNTLYLRQQGWEDTWLFFEAKGGRLAEIFVETMR